MKNSPKRRGLIILTLTLSGLSMLLSGPVALTSTAASQRGERVSENKIPAHLPIKVKVNNLHGPKWPRELELEVRNTGSKPIYFLKLLIVTDVITENNVPAGFSFRYGRAEMASTEAVPTPEDVPIAPGDTHVFKIEEKFAKPWEVWADDPGSRMKPKKFTLMFSSLYFGDGTGFGTTGGTPIPDRRASGAPCDPKGAARAAFMTAKAPPAAAFQGRVGLLAGKLLTGKFFPRKNEQPGAGRTHDTQQRLLL